MSRLHHYKIPNFCVPLPPSYISSIGIISAPPPPPSHRSLLRPSAKFSPARCSLNPKFPSRSALPPKRSVPVPARDRIIKFGKHKGKMLGALPSAYLQWMYKNSVVWPDLAKEVLDDPVYKDRIEWEYVQRILHGDFGGARIREQHQSDDVVADIYEIADKFDWDMEDKRGWSKVELELLGTSFSGPIPRKNEAKAWWSTKLQAKASPEEEAMVGMGHRRRERRERRILKSDRELGVGLERREERVTVKTDGELGAAEEESRSDGDGQVVPGKSQEPMVRKGISFPGRESLLKKAKFHSLMTDSSRIIASIFADNPIGKLPDHLLIEIFIRVPLSEWVQLSCVKKQWANLFREECLWNAALLRNFPFAGHAKRWPGPIPRGLSKRRYTALYISKHIFSLDTTLDENHEIVGHIYLFLKEQLEISIMPTPAGILHGTIIDQFIACGKTRDKAYELASQIWLSVIDNLEENEHTFLLLKRLALEEDVFLPYPYTRSQKVQWRVFEKLFTDFRDCFNHDDYYDVLACAKHKFQPIPSAWLGY